MRSLRRDLVVGGSLAAVYVLAGRLGLSLAVVHASASAVWPPTGIALAALLIFGYRYWPVIFVGAFLVNVTTSGAVATSLGIAAGNTLEAVLGAGLVNRYAGGRKLFERPYDTFRFAVLLAPAATSVSATIGVTTLCLGGLAAWSNYPSIWLTWWLGDLTGAYLVTPFFLLWAAHLRLRWSRAQAVEFVLLLVCLVLFGLVVFADLFASPFNEYPIQFLITPILLWAAFRFGPREAVTTVVVLAAIAIQATLNRHGPFTRTDFNESLLLLQTFLGVHAVTTAAVAAVVAERRRAEHAVVQLNRDLERRVAERTAELQRSNAELEAFTYSVSHDLRAPVRHVHMFASFLREDFGEVLDPAALDYIERIQGGVSQMQRLIDDLLKLSSVGRHELKKQPTDLREIVHQVVGDLRSENDGRDIEWQIGPLPVCECDPGLVKLVFSNLLANAAKFTCRRPKAVISVGQAPVDGLPAVFVRDNGVGFDDCDPRLFGVFQRLMGSEDFEGTGVGLATVQRIIHKHGGRIWAESRPGQGATFYFTLSSPTDPGSSQ